MQVHQRKLSLRVGKAALPNSNSQTPDLTDEQLAAGERMVCPFHWQKKILDALCEGTESYMVGLMENANLLAIHVSWRSSYQGFPVPFRLPDPSALLVEALEWSRSVFTVD